MKLTQKQTRRIRRLVMILFALIAPFVISEALLRITQPPPPPNNDTLAAHVSLYSPGITWYDIHGLYDGAGTVEVRVMPSRFIAPEPTRGKYKVLFLGGSTTETIYVPENQRWVGRVSDDTIAAYNGAMSGQSVIDEYGVFQYLTEQGNRYDLVVLATPVNDYGWLLKFNQTGDALRFDTYQKGQTDYYNATTPWLLRVSLLAQRFDRRVNYTPLVVEQYKMQQRQFYQGKQIVDACPDQASVFEQFQADERENLQRFVRSVQATGAQVLAMSESNSFLAPASSFKVDVRYTQPCGTSQVLSYVAQAGVYAEMNRIFLEEARRAGAEVFDLAKAMQPYTQGADGGKYTYDAVHYTPIGCGLVAPLVHDAVLDVLEPVF